MPIPKAYSGSEPYIFICYAHKDAAAVYEDIRWLTDQGFNVWYDEGISPGSNWRASIGNALLGASHVLFFVSEASIESIHCNGEISLSLDEGLSILPIYVQEVDLPVDLKIGLVGVQALRQNAPDYRDKLQRSLRGEMLTRTVTRSSHQLVLAPPRHRRALLITVLAAVGLIFAGFWQWYGTKKDIAFYESMAVLPFTSAANDQEVEVLASGITDTIMDELAETKWLKLASRTTSFALAKDGLSLKALAEQMNVAFILEGSAQSVGGAQQITTNLIRAEDNFRVWSETFVLGAGERSMTEKQVASRIALFVEFKLWSDVKKKHPELFPEYNNIDKRAVSLYQSGEDQIDEFLLGANGDLDTACGLFQAAAELDTKFTRALFYHGQCNVLEPMRRQSLSKSIAAVEWSLGHMREKAPLTFLLTRYNQVYLLLDYKKSDVALKLAMKKTPGAPNVRRVLGMIAAREGRLSDAAEYFRQEQAMVVEKLGAEIFPYISFLLHIGEYERAIVVMEPALRMTAGGRSRGMLLMMRAHALIGLGDLEQARTVTEEAWTLNGLEEPEQFVYAFAKLGDIERAKVILAKVEPSYVNNNSIAIGHLALNNHARAFEFLRRGIDQHDPSVLPGLRLDVALDELRSDPRFDELLKSLEVQENNTDAYQPMFAEAE